MPGNDPKVFPDQTPEIHSFVVEDILKVPDNISAGEWVVGWRWCDHGSTAHCWARRAVAPNPCSRALVDVTGYLLLMFVGADVAVCRDCEQTSQIWSTCADITIV